MSKELNIIEAIKMPVGTEFKVVYQDGKEDDVTIKVSNFEYADGNKLMWSDGGDIFLGNNFILATFIPIEKPVSFMEAIKQNHYNNKTIRCEVNDKIYTYEPVEIKTIEVRAKETNGGISTEEILNGKWYIEY